MSAGRRAGRVAVSTATLFLLSAALALPAQAALAGTSRTARSSVTSGAWQALATQQPAAPYVSGPLLLTYGVSVLAPPPPQYFSVVNTGSLSLTGATYTAAVTAGSASATVQACVGGSWNETANTCSGTVTTVATAGGGPTSSSVAPVSAGSPVRLRATVTTALSLATTLRIDVSVTRAQVRTATVTSS